MKFTKKDISLIKNQYPVEYHHHLKICIVEQIIDGDSLKCYQNGSNKKYEIRLAGIDAPEGKQKYGIEARRKVEDLFYFDKSFIMIPFFRDIYQRLIADVWIDSTQLLQSALVKEGLALVESHPIVDHQILLKKLQEEARQAKLNYWNQKDRKTPKSFRRSQKK